MDIYIYIYITSLFSRSHKVSLAVPAIRKDADQQLTCSWSCKTRRSENRLRMHQRCKRSAETSSGQKKKGGQREGPRCAMRHCVAHGHWYQRHHFPVFPLSQSFPGCASNSKRCWPTADVQLKLQNKKIWKSTEDASMMQTLSWNIFRSYTPLAKPTIIIQKHCQKCSWGGVENLDRALGDRIQARN